MMSPLVMSCAVVTVIAVLLPLTQNSAEAGSIERRLDSTRNQRYAAGGTFVFPDEASSPDDTLVRGGVSSDATPTPVPPCPDGKTFCESRAYPKEHIKSLLKKDNSFLFDHFVIEEDDADVNRLAPLPGPNDVQLCSSSPETIYPNTGKSKQGLFEYIVNDEDNRQGIKVEACSSGGRNNGGCNIPGTLSNGYQSRCIQKYILRTLVVFSNTSSSGVEGFITKPFEFPSCCSCSITFTGNRMGSSLPTSPANSSAAP